jgi:glycosyltransferase involved in cell wall biosynthesis
VEKFKEWFGYAGAICLPNGVDLGHFVRGHYEEPEDLRAIPGPRAMYVGALNHWFDVDLLAHSAAALPDVSFVVIGPTQTDLGPLKRLANVHLLGARPYERVPDYLAHAQVGLIPFKREERTDSVSSIKLMQYLAVGLPTVSTRWKELERLAPPILLASNKEEFCGMLRRSLAEPAPRGPLVQFARQHSWTAKAETLLGIIAGCGAGTGAA